MTGELLLAAVVGLIAAGITLEMRIRRGKRRPLSRLAGTGAVHVPLGHEAVDQAALDAGVRRAQGSPLAMPQHGVNHTKTMSLGPSPLPDDENHAARWQRAFGKQD